jgi:YVTN family beta-propeller protein
MSSELPRGTVTFLFTDIEGSTQLVKSLGGDRYHRVLAEHQRILRDTFRESGGREIDTQGDSFLFAFGRAKDALVAAVTAQRALVANDWSDGSEPRVRMGLDTGEPTVGSDRYVGIGVHRAARIMAAGHGQQVLLSDTTRSLVEDELPPGVSLRDLGERRLKDLDRPLRLHQLVAPGLPAEFPPLRTVDTGGRRLRRTILAATAAVLVGAVVAAVVLLSGGGGFTVKPNSLAALDLTTGKLLADTQVGDTPTSTVVGGNAVWVLNSNEQTISSVDPRSRKVRSVIPAGNAPTSLVVTGDVLWVTTSEFTVREIDQGSGAALRTIRLPRSANPLARAIEGWAAADGKQVWATGSGSAERVSPSRRQARIGNFACCTGIAIGGGTVWLADGRALLRLNESTLSREGEIRLPFDASALTFGFGTLWAADTRGNKVWAIDPKTNTTEGSVTVGEHPQSVAVGPGAIWVASADGSVARIDPHTLRLVQEIKVGGSPIGIAVGAGTVWVSVD